MRFEFPYTNNFRQTSNITLHSIDVKQPPYLSLAGKKEGNKKGFLFPESLAFTNYILVIT